MNWSLLTRQLDPDVFVVFSFYRVSMTIPISTLWLAEIVKGKQQYINVGVQLHLKVIDDSLPKQGKANQGKGLFCTSSRTNEVPFIAHELVQHLPTAQCSFSKHEHDSSTKGGRKVKGQGDANQLMMPVSWWCWCKKYPWLGLLCLALVTNRLSLLNEIARQH